MPRNPPPSFSAAPPGPAHDHRAARGESRTPWRPPGSCPPPSPSSAPSPASGKRSRGSSALRFMAGRSPSPAPARRPASSPRTLHALGANVVQAPAIRIEPRACRRRPGKGARCNRDVYDLICLTSANGACAAASTGSLERGRDARALAGLTGGRDRARSEPRDGAGAGSGPTSCPRSAKRRRVPARGARRFASSRDARVLIPRAAQARDVLPDGLTERGAHVDVAGALRHRQRGSSAPRCSRRWPQADYVTFTSSSTVTCLLSTAVVARRTERAWCRSAPSRAPPLASAGSKSTWRPSATNSLEERSVRAGDPSRRLRHGRERACGIAVADDADDEPVADLDTREVRTRWECGCPGIRRAFE